MLSENRPPDPLTLFSECGKALHPFHGMRGFALFLGIFKRFTKSSMTIVGFLDTNFTKSPLRKLGFYVKI